MNKKGFTLVEMLAVIVVLSLVIGFSVMSVTKIRNNEAQKLLENKICDLEGSAILYGQENPNDLATSCEYENTEYKFCKEITVKELILNNYYESKESNQENNPTVTNDVTKYSMLCDTILIYRKNNRVYAKMLNVYSNEEAKTC